MRVAIYTRLSPNPNKDDTVNQERDLEEYAKRMDWEIVKRYKDIHVSGSKKGSSRVEFSKMMEDARQKKFDLLLFWALDRLSREGVKETLDYLKKLQDWKVEYKSYTEQYFDSCGIFKDVVIAIMATIAKQERDRIVERTLAGLKTAREFGTKSGKAIGRPKTIIDKLVVKELRDKGVSVMEIAKKYHTTIYTIYRLIKKDKPEAVRMEVVADMIDVKIAKLKKDKIL